MSPPEANCDKPEVHGAHRFGAVYCDYEFSGITAPATVVTFDDPWAFVFWERACYVPWWDLGGVGFCYEFFETTSDETRGCCEPMSDIECRYSRVRILESSPARVVVHWRYALCDVDYRIAFNEWADEYYTFYPDGIGVRKLVGHVRGDNWHEVMEFIVVNPMGNGPADTVDLGRAVTWLGFDGKRSVVSWPNPVFHDEVRQWCSAAARIGIKDRPDPFVVVSEENDLFPGGFRHDPWETTATTTDGSVPPSYYHWPACEEPPLIMPVQHTDDFAQHPTHTCLHSLHVAQNPPVNQDSTWYFLIGLAPEDLTDERLIQMGQGWVSGGEARADDPRLTCRGWDHGEKAFVFDLKGPLGPDESVALTMRPLGEAPLVSPALVVNGWGQADADVEVKGAEAGRILIGHRATLSGADLVVWLEGDVAEPTEVRLKRA